MPEEKEIKYLYFLTQVEKLGNVRIKTLINSFGSAEKVFEAGIQKLNGIPGIDNIISKYITAAKSNFGKFENKFNILVNKCETNDIKIIAFFDKEYPENLKTIFDAPVIIYSKGKLDPKDKYSIGVVGTRYPSEYGKNSCKKIVEGLSELGIPIISGMAKGVDTAAHKTSLDCCNLTYAVLGSGADVVYPFENKALYEKISSEGAVITEYEPGAKPDKINFPKRNRIISGISIGTIIIESEERGGSLITAEFALDQNREVFAVPGSIFSKKSDGTNNLIKKGIAKLVSNVDDIVSELEYKLKNYINRKGTEGVEKIEPELNAFEKKIYDVLNDKPVNIDEICEQTSLDISDCLVNLLTMEFKGVVRQIPGKYFIKI